MVFSCILWNSVLDYWVPLLFFFSFWLYYEINTRHCLVCLWCLNKVSLMCIYSLEIILWFLGKFSFFLLWFCLGVEKKLSFGGFHGKPNKRILMLNGRKFVGFEFWLQKDNFDIVGGQSLWFWAVISCVKTGFQKWVMRTFRHAEGNNLKFWWIQFSYVQCL